MNRKLLLFLPSNNWIMIQRKQSIYLFAASLISGIFAWIGDLWKISTEWIQAEDHMLLLSLFRICNHFIGHFVLVQEQKNAIAGRAIEYFIEHFVNWLSGLWFVAIAWRIFGFWERHWAFGSFCIDWFVIYGESVYQ